MKIRRTTPADGKTLVDVWLRSVRATHAFLSEADIQALLPHTERYLSAGGAELWALVTGSGEIVGFMGMEGSEIGALFLAPEFHRRGGGRLLVEHARALRGRLIVAVNEQNPGAVRFYEALGFVVERRSDFDDEGRPYPLLYMRAPAAPARSGR